MTSSALTMFLLFVCCVLVVALCAVVVLVAYIHKREHELEGKGMREKM